jgi:hypothetical protein
MTARTEIRTGNRIAGRIIGVGALLAAGLAAPAHAERLDELRTRLAGWKATQAVSGTLELTYSRQDHADAAGSVPAVTLGVPVHADRDGVSLRWTPELLARLQKERAEPDPNHRGPVGEGSRELGAERLASDLDMAPVLARWLKDAKLTAEREVDLDGHPARLLEIGLVVPLSTKDKKYVNQVDATLKLWLGPDGEPLAADRRVALKGRALLVIGFEQTETAHYRFSRVGDRLLAVEHTEELAGSGGGESGTTRSGSRLTVDDGVAAGCGK